MDVAKSIFKQIKESFSLEMREMKKLSGKDLEQIINIFHLDMSVEIYFNKFNVAIIDHETHEEMKHYLQEKNLILSVDIPEYNTHLWVYKYYNDRVLSDYLPKI